MKVLVRIFFVSLIIAACKCAQHGKRRQSDQTMPTDHLLRMSRLITSRDELDYGDFRLGRSDARSGDCTLNTTGTNNTLILNTTMPTV